MALLFLKKATSWELKLEAWAAEEEPGTAGPTLQNCRMPGRCRTKRLALGSSGGTDRKDAAEILRHRSSASLLEAESTIASATLFKSTCTPCYADHSQRGAESLLGVR